MNTLRNILIGAAALSALATSAFAQTSAVGTAQTDARIIQPITIASAGTLNFGTITKPTGASVVNVTTAGVRTRTSGDAALAGGTITVPTFTVSGEGAAAYTLSAPAFSLTGPSSATVGVTPILSVTSGLLGGTAGAVGTQAFTVGGNLAIAADQAIGAYSGTLSVTVAYN
jgi:hypothetical protein